MCVSGEPFEPTGDLIADICRRFRQLDADVDAAMAQRIEREARQAYEGERVYIKSLSQQEKRELMARVVPGEPYAVQAARLGLSRSAVWRHLKRAEKNRIKVRRNT